MGMKLDTDFKFFMKQLGKKTAMLQEVGAETLNESAEEIKSNYRLRLKKNARLRNKFSLNSVKIFKANPISRSGEPRPIQKLDALVGVRKMRGGKQHYLDKLEKGGTLRGNPMTRGKVPIPLLGSRIQKSKGKSVSKGNRLLTQETQTLRVRGRKIGFKKDGYKKNSRARWGALNEGIRKGTIQGDVTKPFFFVQKNGKKGIYKKMNGGIRKIRRLDKNTVKRKAEPHFKKSVSQVTPQRIQKRFVDKAKARF